MVTIESKASDFIYCKENIPSNMPVKQVVEFFSVHDIEFVAVTDDLAVAGLTRRGSVAIGESAPHEEPMFLLMEACRLQDEGVQ